MRPEFEIFEVFDTRSHMPDLMEIKGFALGIALKMLAKMDLSS